MTAISQTDILVDMAKSLDRYREERFIGQREFCELIGISQRAYIQLIKGRTQARPVTKRKIAAALGVSPNDILEFELKPEEDN